MLFLYIIVERWRTTASQSVVSVYYSTASQSMFLYIIVQRWRTTASQSVVSVYYSGTVEDYSKSECCFCIL